MLYVTCFEGGQIYVIDPALSAAAAIIEAGRGPNALVFAPDGTTAFVADYADNALSVIDLQPGSDTEYRVVQRIGYPHAVTE
jgi:sugar lactone lactonase YvrE